MLGPTSEGQIWSIGGGYGQKESQVQHVCNSSGMVSQNSFAGIISIFCIST